MGYSSRPLRRLRTEVQLSADFRKLAKENKTRKSLHKQGQSRIVSFFQVS